MRLLIYLVFTVFSLPFWGLYDLWRARSAWNDLLVNGIAYLLLSLILPWAPIGLWLLYLYLLLFFLAVGHAGGWPFVGLFAAILGVIWFSVRIYPRSSAITLQFPLKGGVFYTWHGGACPLTNYHGLFVKAQHYACDFARLNRWGTRALGVCPRKLEHYSIYGATVYSPRTGIILRSVDGLPDLPPGKMDNANAPGNHVIIRLHEVETDLLLAHLKNGSLLVKTGDRVTTGQPIGKVGNSGRTSEPHLHIHAQKQVTKAGESEWVGVPIRFSSRWLVRNSVVAT